MTDINHVTVVGHLVRDAELKRIGNNTSVSKFSIASNYLKKNGDCWEDEVNFFDIVLWGKQGEALSQYLKKGKQVGIEGELRHERWLQDGQSRSRAFINAYSIQLFGENQKNHNEFIPGNSWE